MISRDSALTPRQRRFCAALLTSRTVADAGAAVGIKSRQAFVYLELASVRAELARLLDEAQGQAVRMAINAMAGALATLENITVDVEQPASVRVQAAKAILENGIKLRSELDLSERITALEMRWNEQECAEAGCD